ncbi:Uncharacterized protein TPAR_05004 [Tolypocladium paradoxum]|uniref:Uncharacterized protein n=1 Tax=Tolypocladium paradoxum TaxID=94208 RepID=A0A2S4KX66_9HYPO|nr:Uncharacterized protein TPAR_05004 [Tolypocladium paradoxum]
MAPIYWDIQAFPDGPIITLNGTIHEMRRQLLEINPNYDTDFNRTTVATRDLERRTDFSGAKYFCGMDTFGELNYGAYLEGIQYLRNHLGVPHMLPGPKVCGRVSCSYGTGIIMCNDTPDDKYLDNWGSVADGAQYIWQACGDTKLMGLVGGQVFHYTNWNVILRAEPC